MLAVLGTALSPCKCRGLANIHGLVQLFPLGEGADAAIQHIKKECMQALF